jgi:hypothetical protein
LRLSRLPEFLLRLLLLNALLLLLLGPRLWLLSTRLRLWLRLLWLLLNALLLLLLGPWLWLLLLRMLPLVLLSLTFLLLSGLLLGLRGPRLRWRRSLAPPAPRFIGLNRLIFLPIALLITLSVALCAQRCHRSGKQKADGGSY